MQQMSKGPKADRDRAKAEFEASVSALELELAIALQEAAAVANEASLDIIEPPLPSTAQCSAACVPRSVRIESEKRRKWSNKRADYLCRRVHKEMQRLHASADPDFFAVAKMIEMSGANLEYRFHGRQTLLHVAACMGMQPVIACLLRAGATVNARDEENRSALMIAASRDSYPSIEVIINHMNHACSASLDEVEYCMNCAVAGRNTMMAELLLRHVRTRRSLDYRKFLDWCLIAAAAAADPRLLRLFLQEGASASAADTLRRSSLMHVVASKVGQPPLETLFLLFWILPLLQAEDAHMCVRMLLDYRADPTARDSFGRPVLVIASLNRSECLWRDARILCELLNRGAAEDSLVIAQLNQVICPTLGRVCLLLRLFIAALFSSHQLSGGPVLSSNYS
jgi:hypothetical protein